MRGPDCAFDAAVDAALEERRNDGFQWTAKVVSPMPCPYPDHEMLTGNHSRLEVDDLIYFPAEFFERGPFDHTGEPVRCEECWNIEERAAIEENMEDRS